MAAGATERTGIAAERLHWSVDISGHRHDLDLLPAIFGRSVTVAVDRCSVGRIAKPTPQQPRREAALAIDGETVHVLLTWHFPVMLTDVFVRGSSLMDGRSLDAGRACAPPSSPNYDVWFGGLFRVPWYGSRPRPPRAWPAVILASAVPWVAALALPPVPPAVRLAMAVALVVSSWVLLLAFVWSWLAFSQRVHVALLARRDWGDARRVLVFFGSFIGYPLAWGIAVAVSMVLATR